MLWIWIVITLFNVSLHHCGHEVPLDELPGLGSMTHQHDYHHKAFNCNFGVIGVMDYLYGTRERSQRRSRIDLMRPTPVLRLPASCPPRLTHTPLVWPMTDNVTGGSYDSWHAKWEGEAQRKVEGEHKRRE